MRGVTLCYFVIMVVIPAPGSGEEEGPQLMESVLLEEVEEYLTCFRCDLGFWDTCFTTETNCSLGERCFTGRGKAADVLDVKTLGCVKAEQCGVETTVELFSNETIFIMTKHCCNTSFCNSAHALPLQTFVYLTVAFLLSWSLTGDSYKS